MKIRWSTNTSHQTTIELNYSFQVLKKKFEKKLKKYNSSRIRTY